MPDTETFVSEIGGYLDISANAPSCSVPLIALNAGRFCLEYIVRARGYKKVYLPFYSCHSLADAVRNAGVEVAY